MGYAEKRGEYWRGRYKMRPGQYDTVKDASGKMARFRSRRDAEHSANDRRGETAKRRWSDPDWRPSDLRRVRERVVRAARPGGLDDAELPPPARGAPAACVRVTRAEDSLRCRCVHMGAARAGNRLRGFERAVLAGAASPDPGRRDRGGTDALESGGEAPWPWEAGWAITASRRREGDYHRTRRPPHRRTCGLAPGRNDEFVALS
jgi:hypothetical protein